MRNGSMDDSGCMAFILKGLFIVVLVIVMIFVMTYGWAQFTGTWGLVQ